MQIFYSYEFVYSLFLVYNNWILAELHIAYSLWDIHMMYLDTHTLPKILFRTIYNDIQIFYSTSY